MFSFPPALCPWGSSLLNELTEQLCCAITAVAQRWLQPDSGRGRSQWLPDLERDSMGPGAASSRRENKDDANQDLHLPPKCSSLGVLKKTPIGLTFLKGSFSPEILNLPQQYSSTGAPALRSPPRGGSRGGHWCPWAWELCKEQGKLSQWTPQKSLSEEKRCCSGSSEPRKHQFLILLKQSPLKFTF